MLAIPKADRLARTTMAYVLAGGRGSRLMELTDRRAKPAVYFGGKSRIIDFALSNALNSGIRRIGVATQYKAHSLIRHLQRGWNFFRAERNESFDILPASQRVVGDRVVRRHRRRGLPEHRHHRELRARLHRHPGRRPHLQDGLRADAAMQHVERKADVTVGCIEVPRERGHRASASCRRRERPHRRRSSRSRPIRPACRTSPDMALASMGIYVFATQVPVRPAAPRRRRPELQPRFRQGHHSLPGEARQGGGASLHALLRALRPRPRPTGATSARSTPTGRRTST